MTTETSFKMKIAAIFLAFAVQYALAQDCGIPTVPPNIGLSMGNSKAASWPWKVAIEMNFEPWCAGTLIAPNWVLTAAKCVDGYENNVHDFVLRVGDPTKGQPELKLDSIFKHPSFDIESDGDDIALLKLSAPVAIGDDVRPACLPKKGAPSPVGAPCFLIQQTFEWTQNQAVSNIFQRKLKVVSNGECTTVKKTMYWKSIRDTMMCASDSNKAPSHLSGQIGGPMVCRTGADGSWVLHGATSWAFKDANSLLYDVFTSVSKYEDWIEQIQASNV